MLHHNEETHIISDLGYIEEIDKDLHGWFPTEKAKKRVENALEGIKQFLIELYNSHNIKSDDLVQLYLFIFGRLHELKGKKVSEQEVKDELSKRFSEDHNINIKELTYHIHQAIAYGEQYNNRLRRIISEKEKEKVYTDDEIIYELRKYRQILGEDLSRENAIKLLERTVELFESKGYEILLKGTKILIAEAKKKDGCLTKMGSGYFSMQTNSSSFLSKVAIEVSPAYYTLFFKGKTVQEQIEATTDAKGNKPGIYLMISVYEAMNNSDYLERYGINGIGSAIANSQENRYGNLLEDFEEIFNQHEQGIYVGPFAEDKEINILCLASKQGEEPRTYKKILEDYTGKKINATGIEADPENINHANANPKNRKIKLIHGSICDPEIMNKLVSNKYHLITCNNVLQYLDLEKAHPIVLQTIQRVIKPQGYISIIQDRNNRNWEQLLNAVKIGKRIMKINKN